MREWFSCLPPKQQIIKTLLTYTVSVAVLFLFLNQYWSLFEFAQSMYPLFTIGIALMISKCHHNKNRAYRFFLALFCIIPLIPALPLMFLAAALSGDSPYISTLEYIGWVLFSWTMILLPLLMPLALSFFDWKRLLVKLRLLKTEAQ